MPHSSLLRMESWSRSKDRAPRPGCAAWRIKHRENRPIEFPEDEQLAAIYAKSLPGRGELTVDRRERNGVVIEIPAGTNEEIRKPFIRALEHEVFPVS